METTPEQTMRMLCAQEAARLWASFTDNEKAGVRFGMFPAAAMLASEKAGHDSRMLCVALMDEARRNGGMRA